MKTERLNLKLMERAPVDLTVARLLRIPGVVSVERLFPGETDPELSRLYIVETNPLLAEQVLTVLRQDSDVEYAETSPKRKLI